MNLLSDTSLARLAVLVTENGKAILLSSDKWFSGRWLVGRPVLDDGVVVFMHRNEPVAIMPLEEFDDVYSAILVYVGHIDGDGEISTGQPVNVFWQ